jgi:hypothetical protein
VRKRSWIAGPIGAIAASITAIGLQATGESMPGWGFYVWPGCVIIWSLFVIEYQQLQNRNMSTIRIQAEVIRGQGELLAQVFDDRHEHDG